MKEGKFSILNETVRMDDDSDVKSNSRYPYLVVFIGKDSGKRYKIKPGTLTIGRSPQADITVEDDRVSRIHCQIKWVNDIIAIEDQGSKNGTYVDSQRTIHARLTPGIPFQLGQTMMKIEYKTDAEIRAEESLLRKASIDALTGIYNRQHFCKLASMEIAYARRHKQNVGIIMIDIDNFKQINDTYGHSIGDFVLARFAVFISKIKRTEDIFGRYGGEEFIILPRGEINIEAIYTQCERIREAVERYEFCHSETCIRLTISVGFHIDKLNNGKIKSLLTDLINKADQALYLAKKKGKNQTHTLL